jgi:hypothetical protein
VAEDVGARGRGRRGTGRLSGGQVAEDVGARGRRAERGVKRACVHTYTHTSRQRVCPFPPSTPHTHPSSLPPPSPLSPLPRPYKHEPIHPSLLPAMYLCHVMQWRIPWYPFS